jgi:hypothetical protein
VIWNRKIPDVSEDKTNLPRATLRFVDDTHTFVGQEGAEVQVEGGRLYEVTVHGSEMGHSVGDVIHADNIAELYPDDSEPAGEQLFFFKVAGVGHHGTGTQTPGFAPKHKVLLLREPTNNADRNAIKVVDETRTHQCGYVPAGIAAIMAPLMDRAGLTGTLGVVIRTYSTGGRRIALEVFGSAGRPFAIGD